MGTLYDRDFYAWASQQAGLLRAGRLGEAADAYQDARIEAAGETNLEEATFPPECTWTWAQIMAADFWPEADQGA